MYGHGPEGKTEEDRTNSQLTHLKTENEILKKYLKGVDKRIDLNLVGNLRRKYTVTK
ncbi:hypothetical protein [Alteribacillus bidgolensis]|uniref:Uncharacterized protein n=1 Tax=Alteribacillus bidgolensis TaxID=930129 RepID=A0A1G8CGJ6_9BACI|nr:hypothetical protein [Alteribacillus bidgolensis]SDH44567.1 hypothetical protein SAMN05216352_101314 [Alteribacillus bidgolensis]